MPAVRVGGWMKRGEHGRQRGVLSTGRPNPVMVMTVEWVIPQRIDTKNSREREWLNMACMCPIEH